MTVQETKERAEKITNFCKNEGMEISEMYVACRAVITACDTLAQKQMICDVENSKGDVND